MAQLLAWTPRSSYVDSVAETFLSYPDTLKGAYFAPDEVGKLSLTFVWERRGEGEGDQRCPFFPLWEGKYAHPATEVEVAKATIATSPEPGEVLATLCPCGCQPEDAWALACGGGRFAGIIPGRTRPRMLFLVGRVVYIRLRSRMALDLAEQIRVKYPMLASAIGG